MPVAWQSQPQGATSKHFTEAELLALDHAVRQYAYPWVMSAVFNLAMPAGFRVDYEASMTAVENGYSAAVRHLAKQRLVSLGILHEC